MAENLPDTNVGNIEYISKHDAVETVDRIFDNVPMELTTEILRLRRELRGLPSADVVQVRHARWENYSPVTIKCSRCGHVIHDWRYSECKYCPNCGAKMDGERKE